MTWSRYVLPCDRQTETERQRDRETERQPERNRDRDRQTERQIDRQTDRENRHTKDKTKFMTFPLVTLMTHILIVMVILLDFHWQIMCQGQHPKS